MKVTNVLNWRYSTKEFDPSKKISAEDFATIKSLLQMSASSTNIQPWHFIIAQTQEGKKRVNKGTQGFFSFNESKIADASHVVIFCSKSDVDETYLQHVLDQEDKDGRYPNEEIKQNVHGGRSLFADIHKYDLKDQQHWMEKQVYLNMGNLLLGAGFLNIDALPMEGLDFKTIDEEFELRKKGFTAVAAVALGYRKDSDFNSPEKTPKSRLPQSEIITIV